MSLSPLLVKVFGRTVQLEQRFKRFLGIDRSVVPQKNTVRYTVSLSNPSKEKRTCNLVLPLPRTDYSTQTLLAEVGHSPTPAAIQAEQRFQNRYAVWRIELAGNDTQTIEQKYEIETRPVNVKSSLVDPGAFVGPIDGQVEPYLTPSQSVDYQYPAFQPIAEKIRAESKTLADRLRAINAYVISRLEYADPIPGLYSATEAYERKRVDCGGFDTLFVALTQACWIPARVVSGFWLNRSKYAMHAWAEVLLPPNNWVPADPSVEQLHSKGRSVQIGELGMIGSDRVVYSVGCDMCLDIFGESVEVDILQTPLVLSPSGEITMTYTLESTRL